MGRREAMQQEEKDFAWDQYERMSSALKTDQISRQSKLNVYGERQRKRKKQQCITEHSRVLYAHRSMVPFVSGSYKPDGNKLPLLYLCMSRSICAALTLLLASDNTNK